MRLRRLPPGALELVVECGVLELIQVERRRVLHQTHACIVREEFAEQALDQHRGPREHLAHEHDADLERDELPQPREVRWRLAHATTASMMSLPTQSVASGMKARTRRSTAIATV